MEKTNQSYLATEKIGKLMGKYAVPETAENFV